MAKPYSEMKHVLVFGSTGTGKTTLINNLAPKFKRETSSSARGVTLSWAEVFTHHKDDKGTDTKYRFIDTAGLNEGDGGSVPAHEALTNLMTLLKTTEGGLNLIIMVTSGKIVGTTVKSFDLFVKTLTSRKVPVIIVQTHLDSEEDPSEWADMNKHFFVEAGMNDARIVGTTFPRHNPRRDGPSTKWVDETSEESTDRVWRAIQDDASATPEKYLPCGFMETLRRTWNAVAKLLSKKMVWINEQIVIGIQEILGCDREEARQHARRFETA